LSGFTTSELIFATAVGGVGGSAQELLHVGLLVFPLISSLIHEPPPLHLYIATAGTDAEHCGLFDPPFAPRHVQLTLFPGEGKAGVADGAPDEQYVSPPYDVAPAGYALFAVPQTPFTAAGFTFIST
jgi:hypothetical protein